MSSKQIVPMNWNGKKVLITGHTGFKGAWLAIWLKQLGAHVTGYSLQPPTEPSLFQLAKLDSLIESKIGDVRDGIHIEAVVKQVQPDVIFHLAAQSLVRESYEKPVDTYATNIMGTVNVLESVRLSGKPCAVVVITTDKCYENREWPWGYRENEPLGGFDPYSSSKACAELVTAAYRNSFFNSERFNQHGVRIATARAGNVIGGGDWAKDRLIPDVIRSFSQSKPVILRNPLAIRPWQHVLEPLAGYIRLAESLLLDGPQNAEAFNFGPTELDCQAVQDVVGKVASVWGPNARWSVSDDIQPHEAMFLKLDSSKARSKLGWSSKWNLDRAIEATVEWYSVVNDDNSKAYSVTVSQIESYMRFGISYA